MGASVVPASGLLFLPAVHQNQKCVQSLGHFPLSLSLSLYLFSFPHLLWRELLLKLSPRPRTRASRSHHCSSTTTQKKKQEKKNIHSFFCPVEMHTVQHQCPAHSLYHTCSACLPGCCCPEKYFERVMLTVSLHRSTLAPGHARWCLRSIFTASHYSTDW